MIQKFSVINEHKGFYIQILEEPVFSVIFQQIFADSMDDFKKGIINENNSSVMFGINYQEFCILVSELLPYWEKLQETGHMVENLINADASKLKSVA